MCFPAPTYRSHVVELHNAAFSQLIGCLGRSFVIDTVKSNGARLEGYEHQSHVVRRRGIPSRQKPSDVFFCATEVLLFAAFVSLKFMH